MDDQLARLSEQVRTLETRVTALEDRPAGTRAEPPAGSHAAEAPSSPRPHEETFWALTGLRERRPDHPTTANGQVMIIGSLDLPGDRPVEWQQAAPTDGLLETTWDDLAPTFASLGHPVRLELLRHILSGMSTTAELAATESLGTTGQLHHHLRQLVAGGWVRQSGRGRYEVPARRIVPLLACLTGAER